MDNNQHEAEKIALGEELMEAENFSDPKFLDKYGHLTVEEYFTALCEAQVFYFYFLVNIDNNSQVHRLREHAEDKIQEFQHAVETMKLELDNLDLNEGDLTADGS
jgi:hypothetical protein